MPGHRKGMVTIPGTWVQPSGRLGLGQLVYYAKWSGSRIGTWFYHLLVYYPKVQDAQRVGVNLDLVEKASDLLGV